MKFLFLFFVLPFFSFDTSNEWLKDFDQAQKIAAEKNQNILINFSGSDWCGPCMRMRKEIFEADDFKSYSADHLVLLNADFPRNKKNRLDKLQQEKNDKLADKYNPGGKFPYTILITAGGKVIKEWDGLPGMTAKEFVKQIKPVSDN
ncbi:MAG: thioredoxin family protein [Ferruginibacter sp.]